MSFFATTTNIHTKPHIRQEGFSPDDLFSSSSTGLHGKYPSSPLNLPSMDFGDELAGLMADANGNNHRSSPPNGYHQQQQQQQQHDQYRTHNIFDTSSVSSTASAYPYGQGSQPSSLHPDFPSFNSTIPALNSSMRYDPHTIDSSPSTTHATTNNPPPSSFHSHSHFASNNGNGHTPSPISVSVGSTSLHSPIIGPSTSVGGRRYVGSRSRSRSRPPSSSSNSSSNNPSNGTGVGTTGSIGPARTSRTRRNSSISGTSPPPFGHGHGRPHAIVIPGNGRGGGGGAPGAAGGSWFVNNGQSSSHPTNHHHSLSLSLGGGNGASHLHHANSHSLTIPKSQIEFNSSTSSTTTTASNASPLLTTHPLVIGNGHPHHGGGGNNRGHAPSLSHSLSHSGTLNGAMGSMGISGFGNMGGMNMGSMGSMGSMMDGMGLSLGHLQSSSLQNNIQSIPHPPPITASSQTSQPSLAAPTTTPSSNVAHPTDKQSLLANEKRRRRRESHNAVERRRRDNINEKISELATLIPECMLEGGGGVNGNVNGNGGSSSPTSPGGGIGVLDNSDPLLPSSFGLSNGSGSPVNGGGVKEENGNGGGAGGEGEVAGVVKANKGMVLRKSVDYIRYLQQLVTAQGARNRELEQELKAYRRSSSTDSPKLNGGYPRRRRVDGTHATPPSMSTPDESKEDGDDIWMLHDGVDGGMVSGIEFGSYGRGGGGDGRGGLPSMPEGDDEDDDDSQHQQQHHHNMEVDNLGLDMNMVGMMGGGMIHFDTSAMDNAENLRGRTRVVKRGGAEKMKEEIGDDDNVQLGFGRGM